MVVNVFLFDDFEVMDAFGPVQIFGCVPEHFYIRLLQVLISDFLHLKAQLHHRL